MKAVSNSETSVNIYEVCGATSQKTAIFGFEEIDKFYFSLTEMPIYITIHGLTIPLSYVPSSSVSKEQSEV
jgi:hypothetical protein